jgi:hypothetical protein
MKSLPTADTSDDLRPKFDATTATFAAAPPYNVCILFIDVDELGSGNSFT